MVPAEAHLAPPEGDGVQGEPAAACSAVRRAMSRPRPVDPPPLRAPAQPSAGGQAGPGVGHDQHAPPPGPQAEPHGERRAVRGVREDVAQQRVHARRQLVRGRPPPAAGPGRGRASRPAPVSSASTDQNATRSATTAAASHAGRAGRARRRACVDDRRDRPLERVHGRRRSGPPPAGSRSDSASSRSAVSGVRSAVRQVGDLSRSCAAAPDPAGQMVERPATARDLRRARPGAARASSSPRGQPVRDRGQLGDRRGPGRGPAGRRPAGRAASSATPSRAEHQPGPGDPAGQLGVR